MEKNFRSISPEDTRKIGEYLASLMDLGDIVTFEGDLGTGKTELIKGICNFFDVEEIVTSPTFTLQNSYYGKFDGNEFGIYHIDLYRIEDPKELINIGFDEVMADNEAIKLIEWPDKAGDGRIIPKIKVRITTDDSDENVRYVEIIT
ncbi:hypothetical protein MASR1M45_21240 [Candidatus Kapaibacterium sp.]